MVKDCKVTVEEGVLYGLKIKKKKGLFSKVSAKPKAAICPICVYVALYIENYKGFKGE
jgi:hypothetical protein